MRISGVNYCIGNDFPSWLKLSLNSWVQKIGKKLSSKGGETPTPVSIAHLVKKGDTRSNQSSTLPSSHAPKPTPREGNASDTMICSYYRNYCHLKKDCRKLAWKEEQIRKGTWIPKDPKRAYVASEGGELSTITKENDGSEIQEFIQSEMNKILQTISSTSLVKSGEHFAFTTYNNLTPISESWILDSGRLIICHPTSLYLNLMNQ